MKLKTKLKTFNIEGVGNTHTSIECVCGRRAICNIASLSIQFLWLWLWREMVYCLVQSSFMALPLFFIGLSRINQKVREIRGLDSNFTNSYSSSQSSDSLKREPQSNFIWKPSSSLFRIKKKITQNTYLKINKKWLNHFIGCSGLWKGYYSYAPLGLRYDRIASHRIASHRFSFLISQLAELMRPSALIVL